MQSLKTWIGSDKNPKVLDPLKFVGNREIELLKAKGYDLDFLKKIMPQGGLFFDEEYVYYGNGISRCVTVYKYTKDPNLFWLATLMNNPHTIATMDVRTDEKQEVINTINKAMDELDDRTENERKATDRHKSAEEYVDLARYAQSLTSNGEVSKRLKVRVHVYGKTREEVDERAQQLIESLKSMDFRGVTYLHKAKQDWLSMFKMSETQEKWFGDVRGQSVPALNIGGGYPFHHQMLKDPGGTEYGETLTGGPFVWNVTLKNSIRWSTNMVFFGSMGAGKSTALKMIAEAHLPIDDFIWGFEKGKDFIPFLTYYGGTMVRLDGSDGMINPLEIFATRMNDEATEVNQAQSYITHLDKVTYQVQLVHPHLKGTMKSEFKLYLNRFYEAKGLIPKGLTKDHRLANNVQITGLAPEKYPTFSEFYDYLRQLDLSGFSPEKVTRKEAIEVMVQELCETYGTMFDGHSTITHLNERQLVFFDIDSITGLDRGVQQCQMYMAMTLIWNQALIQGRKQRTLVRQGLLDPKDFIRFLAYLDECHNIINPEYIETVDYVTNFQREMRKVEAMTVLATQSPQEMVPENTKSETFSKLKKVFEFSSTKIFMRMDESVLEHIGKLVGKSVTRSELDSIPQQEKGDAVINFGNKETIRVHFIPNERQLKLFDGGQ
ncbi:VirB4 family type IV secretion system protein [Enterococcus gilvus]|uniref:VirB4 family type IV secretion system protein n=1 Tax=Enterococcus gilvus TaxID=160453 RepID=UPI003ED9D3A4